MKASKAAAFLENMIQEPVEIAKSARREKDSQSSKGVGTRAGLKHIGGYLDAETVEKVAILRARLNLDNSELIKFAINELYSKQKAKRAFNDQ